MKRYITTEHHPTFRTGIILKVNSGHKISCEDGTIIGINKDGFNCWLSDRWIRECQDPKWTDNQLIDCVNKAVLAFITKPDKDRPEDYYQKIREFITTWEANK